MGKSNVITRILTAVVLVPLALALVFKGPAVLVFAVVMLVSVVGVWELSGLLGGTDPAERAASVVAASAVLLGASYDAVLFQTVLAVVFSAVSVYLLFAFGVDGFIARLGRMAIAVAYIPLLLSFAFRLIEIENGRGWLFFLLLVNWSTDTFAYAAGTTVGRHGLTRISPKKTVEGLAGGIIGGIAAAFIVHYTVMTGVPLFAMCVLGAAGSIVGQTGDIVESGLKRCAGVKDSGAVIPGHGGILDRFDSLLFTAPLFYVAAGFVAG